MGSREAVNKNDGNTIEHQEVIYVGKCCRGWVEPRPFWAWGQPEAQPGDNVLNLKARKGQVTSEKHVHGKELSRPWKMSQQTKSVLSFLLTHSLCLLETDGLAYPVDQTTGNSISSRGSCFDPKPSLKDTRAPCYTSGGLQLKFGTLAQNPAELGSNPGFSSFKLHALGSW